MGRVSQSVEYTAAGALIRYTDTAGDEVSNSPDHNQHHEDHHYDHTMSITIIFTTMSMMLIR